MGHSRRSSGNPSNLCDSCHQRLNAYALAASAAGLLTFAPPADAKIVYTPANVPLMNQQQVFLDLNHDGINDFSFYGRSISRRSVSTFFFRLTASPAQRSNAIWGVESHEHASCAAPLARDTRVGPKRPYQANRVVLLDWSGGPDGGTAYCPLTGKTGTAYLGLKFEIKGQTHFGWARVKVLSIFPYKVSLTGYAYETTAGKPIVTGKTKGPTETAIHRQSPTVGFSASVRKPATVGLLALGWPAVSIWRRRNGGTQEDN